MKSRTGESFQALELTSSEMKIAIVHHHLRPGGVTRVIESAVRALNQQGVDVAIFSAGPVERVYPALRPYWREVPELDYQEDADGAHRLEKALLRAAKQKWASEPDLWHVHNHSLGKNPAWTQLVAKWAMARRRFLLQIHDFAEDGRPELYRRLNQSPASVDSESAGSLTAKLYPNSSRVHYACLNRRDWRILTQNSLDPDRVHLLPNPIQSFSPTGPVREFSRELDIEADEVWLYPTRSIRRKNVGEALYWASRMVKGQAVALTLPPNNPESMPVYRKWVEFAKRLKLPVVFETGLKSELSFEDWCLGCQRFITTSVAEGFGMAFLESWTWGKPVFGRDLPEITEDFKRDGMALKDLYETLPVSLEGMDLSAIRSEWMKDYQRAMESYGQWNPDHQQAAEKFLERWLNQEQIDFGQLKEKYQRQILDRDLSNGINHKGAHLSIQRLRKQKDKEKQLIRSNQQVLKEKYSESSYGKSLREIYENILNEDDSETEKDFFPSQPVLEAFLGPERFQWLRT